MKENGKKYSLKGNGFMRIIGHIKTDFRSKFGIPRQSGLVREVVGKIIFEPEFRNVKAIKGLELFSHMWIIWQFSENEDYEWQPTVRPPALGGNKRVGVFATRSPYRPNPIGISAVKIVKISQYSSEGPVIYVQGPDLMDGTPIYDIKPYIPYADKIDDAVGGFSTPGDENKLRVVIPEDIEGNISRKKKDALVQILANDPRPAYHNDSKRIYKFSYADYVISFKVSDSVAYVTSIEKEIY